MTHAEQVVRRKAIAEAVRTGMTLGDVAAKWNLSLPTVRAACQIHRVKVTCHRESAPLSPRTLLRIKVVFRMLCLLQQRDKSLAEIAEEFSVSHQWVSTIEHMALDAGLLAPRSYVENTKGIYRREKPNDSATTPEDQ